MKSTDIFEKLTKIGNYGEALNDYALVYDKGRVEYKEGTICFAQWYDSGVTQMIFALRDRGVEGYYNPDDKTRGFDIKDESFIRYLDYILNRSPYRRTFVNKNPVEVRHSFIEPDMSRSMSEISSGLTAVRSGYEFAFAELFCFFIDDYGMTEHQAFLMCSFTRYEVPFNKEKFVRKAVGNGHGLFDTPTLLSTIIRVLEGNGGNTAAPKCRSDEMGFGNVFAFYSPLKSEKEGLTLQGLSTKLSEAKTSMDAAVEIFKKEWNNAVQ